MTVPAFVTIDGFRYRGTTAFARGWVDGNGTPIARESADAYAPSQIGSTVDLLLAALSGASTDRDITADVDTDALEAALATLGREKLAYIAPQAPQVGDFASLAAVTTYVQAITAKQTALLAALVAKGYMAAS
jgi:hypothetical protein